MAGTDWYTAESQPAHVLKRIKRMITNANTPIPIYDLRSGLLQFQVWNLNKANACQFVPKVLIGAGVTVQRSLLGLLVCQATCVHMLQTARRSVSL